MKVLDLLASEDNIRETLIDDTIGRSEDICYFISLLNSLDGGMTIAINAKWGEGKTFFVKQVKMMLEAMNPYYNDVNQRENLVKIFEKFIVNKEVEMPPFVTVYYDAWMNDTDEDPVLSLILSIMQEIDGLVGLENDRDFVDAAGNLLNCFSGKTIKDVIDSLKGENPLGALIKKKDLEREVSLFLNSIIPERGNKLIVFIDELDRCKPDYAIRLLERIKHYFGNDKIIFVLTLNIDELQHTIRKYYGNDFDACRYLDRFFDFRIELPKPNMRTFYYDIGLNSDEWLFDRMCKQTIEMLHMGLRETAKFYRIAKTVGYKSTHKENTGLLYEFSEGNGRRIVFYCIVPLLVGLSMCDRAKYDKFINGKDGTPLIDLLAHNDNASQICSLLLDTNEVYINLRNCPELILVKLEDKIEEVYRAIFVKKYDYLSYKIQIGMASFSEETKKELFKVLSGLSKYADYTL